jgi:hypothetical protein
MRNRLAGSETLCGLSELLGLDRASDPAVEDLENGCSRLQALRPHRPDGISSYVFVSIHYVPKPGYRQNRRCLLSDVPGPTMQ